jgi:NitT/TauT family transport system permease protein
MKKRHWNTAKILGWTVVPVILIALWEIKAWQMQSPWIFPRASAVAEQLIHPTRDHYNQGSLLSSAVVSLLRVIIGFSFAAVVGVTMGLIMGSVRGIRGLLEPVIELLRPLCPIAWVPFAIAIFKLTTLPQVFGVRYSRTIFDQVQIGMLFVLFWGAFFPILINTLDGVVRVRRDYVTLARMLGAGRARRFIHVNLPASMPMILTGLRQGIGVCWFVIIAAEMLPGSSSGIGYLLLYAAEQSDMSIVIASMIIIGGIGAMLNYLLQFSMHRLIRWQGKET